MTCLRWGLAALSLLASFASSQGLVPSDEDYHYLLWGAEPAKHCGAPGTLELSLERGTLSLDAAGTVQRAGTRTILCAGGVSDVDTGTESGVYALTPGGALLLDFAPGDPAPTEIELRQRFDHALLLFRSAAASVEPTFILALRAPATPATPALAGTYHLVRLTQIQGPGGIVTQTESGTLVISAGGTFTQGGVRHQVSAGGTVNSSFSSSGTISAGPDGGLSVGPGGLPGAALPNGEVLFWSQVAGSALSMTLAVRATPTPAATDVEGTFTFGSLGVDILPSIVLASASGTFTSPADSSAIALSVETTETDSAGITVTSVAGPGSLSVGAGGSVALTTGSPTFTLTGGLGANENVLVGADVTSPGRAEMTLAFRDCVPPVVYGSATPGAGGVAPSLSGAGGLPTPGNLLFTLNLAGGVGGGPAFLFLSSLPSPGLAVAGGSVWIDLASVTVILPATLTGASGVAGAGSTSFPLPVPTGPGAAGSHVYAQAFVLDVAAPGSFAMSAGLGLRICD